MAAAITFLWYRVLAHSGPGMVFVAVGQWTGMGSALGALCAVALMARVPYVTRVLGTDRAARWHRLAAVATTVLVPVHLIAIVIGYGQFDEHSFLAESVHLLQDYPDLVTATVAAALFLAIAATSRRTARRRMGYHRWLFVHWYTYIAIALAFGHEVSLGNSFVRDTTASLVWLWLHVWVAVLVLWFRVLTPLRLMLTHPLHVADVRRESPMAVSLTLAGERLEDYRAEAGQHIRIRFLTRRGWWQSHPFSFSALPLPDEWRITVAAAGDHTAWLQNVPVGTPALVSGVYGNLTVARQRRRRVALIAGGSGVTPIRALLEALPIGAAPRVLYRARSTEELLHADELEHLAEVRGGDVTFLLGGRNEDPRRDLLSSEALLHLVPDLTDRDVYICGLGGFVDRVTTSLQRAGVSPKLIHAERYDP